MRHLEAVDPQKTIAAIDCGKDPVASLTAMFVDQVQAGRIGKGQCPALRPVFLKPHGVAHAVFRILPDLPSDLRVGIFAGSEYPAWVRFSSDTLPTISDYKATVGVGIKLFHAPVPKLFGEPNDQTFDFILQNFDVFFVDNAREMCEFTKAGVVDGDYGPYLVAHPVTAKLLDQMARAIPSVLASDYWSCVPFSFGPDRYVKYKLERTIDASTPSDAPRDPSYLAVDLQNRLKAAEARFRFFVQFRTDPTTMPLDEATVRWEESASVPVQLAELILPQQDIAVRGQAAYGENLSWNIWRVTSDHRPQGSIAEARRLVYASSALLRRNVNGVPTGEPTESRPALKPGLCVDTVIVHAAIHPAIGIARVGDSKLEYYYAPEVVDPEPKPAGYYRDAQGALKRQAARFRIYGYNAQGEVVRELTADSADIQWTVHLANKKAQWYQFQAALDIPDAVNMSVPKRNRDVATATRDSLVIDPGNRSIAGKSVAGGKEHVFDTGTFKGILVSLGEIRTDEDGRLIVLGGFGTSGSPSGAPIYDPTDPSSFNNANDWYDDISDGPITALVSIDGTAVPVEAAWVVVAPPNYAPDIVGWRTLYDLLVDVYIQCGWMQMPQIISFTHDVLPILRRLSNLQWVNKGFAAMLGKNRPMDFGNDDFVAKLAHISQADPFAELRRAIFNCFRTHDTAVNERRTWPWLYGDAFGSFSSASPNNNLPLPSVRQVILEKWVKGNFVSDWSPGQSRTVSFDQVQLSQQPLMLDKASLQFCLADAFHPGCEMTWPMRHASLYEKPFRIRHSRVGDKEPDYGANLTPQIAMQPGGPLYAQSPGDISRWMALPWQGDTASCRSGYEPEYDPYLPTFWPARVPNWVLIEDDYKIVMNTSLPREQRVAAFNNRQDWNRVFKGTPAQVMMQMVTHFGAMGIVEVRPGFKNDADFPEVIYVESLAGSQLKTAAIQAAQFVATLPRPLTSAQEAGWESEEQLEQFRTMRIRHT
jgi:hypothetical protein